MLKYRYYYIYQIKNKLNGKIYIGIHRTNKIRDRYMGSGLDIKKAIKTEGIHNFEKTIIEYFDNQEDMFLREKEIVNEEFVKRSDTYNKTNGGVITTAGEVTKNTIPVKDKNGKMSRVSKNDPRYLSGELVHNTKGNVTVKDKNGNTFNVAENDPRYLSGELVHIAKGTVTVKDKDGNILQVNKNDPRYLSGELYSIHIGKVNIVDKNGNRFQVSKNDPRYLSGELVHHLKGQVTVKDKSGNTFNVAKNDPRYLSGELIPRLSNTIFVIDKNGDKVRVDKNDIKYKKEINIALKLKKEKRRIFQKTYQKNYRNGII